MAKPGTGEIARARRREEAKARGQQAVGSATGAAKGGTKPRYDPLSSANAGSKPPKSDGVLRDPALRAQMPTVLNPPKRTNASPGNAGATRQTKPLKPRAEGAKPGGISYGDGGKPVTRTRPARPEERGGRDQGATRNSGGGKPDKPTRRTTTRTKASKPPKGGWKTPGIIDHPDRYMKKHPNAKIRVLRTGDQKGMAVRVGGPEDKRRRAANASKK